MASSGESDGSWDAPVAPGDSFGRYRIEALLGEGGMGYVYRAFDTRLGRRVALKVIRMAERDSRAGEWAARLLREAQSGAALDHPNAVAVFDIGEIDGVSFIAMELVAGHSLRKYIGNAAIGWQARLRWLIEIADALAAAHHERLIHRDIKPDNIMIRNDGRVKVLDFGIARRIERISLNPVDSVEFSPITQEGGVLGTPLYMAPEQLHGEPLDPRTDQFSWGVVAYELLTGKPPWSGETITIVSQILTKAPAPIRPSVPEIPAEVEAAIMRTLAKQRDGRFAAMGDVIAAIEPFAAAAVTGSTLLPVPHASMPQPAGDWAAQAASHRNGPSGQSILPSHAAPTSASSSRRHGVMIAIGAGALGLAVTLAAVRREHAAPVAVPAPSGSAPAAGPVPTAITDLAVPAAVNPEALAAYREGIQGLRDAAWESVAHAAFERAVELDPAFAAARLRLALTSIFHTRNQFEQRDRFQKAILLRSSLNERDQVLLDALLPLFQHEPPDPWEATRRLEAASKRYPGDAEFINLTTLFKVMPGPHETLETTERCLAIDPRYADCWQIKAQSLARLERTADALDAFTRCLEVSPAANDCVGFRSMLMQWTGQCDRFEEDARVTIANDPKSPYGYRNLAVVLHRLGRPLAAVRAALDQAKLRMPESQRTRAALTDDWALSVSAGKFEDAEHAALEWNRQVAGSPAELDHIAPTRALVELYQETGQDDKAAAVARGFLDRRDAWTKPMRAAPQDPQLFLLKAQLQAGAVSARAYQAARSAWLRTWEGSVADDMRGVLWATAYAWPATTAEDAGEALGVQPKLMHSIYYWISPSFTDALAGKVYLLAGRPQEALPYLTRAVADCSVLYNPFRHTIAHYHLGAALEQTGDRRGACAAYQVVLDRWGAAKPASLTAEKARTQSKALGCTP